MHDKSRNAVSGLRIDKLDRGGYRFALCVEGTDVMFSVRFGSRTDAIAAVAQARDRLLAGNIACAVPRGKGRAHFMILSPRATLLARSIDFDSERAMETAIARCVRIATSTPGLDEDTRPVSGTSC